MRFVRALTIASKAVALASAALVTMPVPAWSQQTAPKTATRAAANKTSLAAPKDVEGAWVSDETPVPPSPPAMMPGSGGVGSPSYPGIASDSDAGAGAYPTTAPRGYPTTQQGGNPQGGYPQGAYPPSAAPGYSPGAAAAFPRAAAAGFDDPTRPYTDPSQYDEDQGEGPVDAVAGLFAPGSATPLWDSVHAHQRYYGKLQTLIYSQRGNPVPALVTTSPVGTAQAAAGVLGQPTTTTIFGAERIDRQLQTGARIDLGYWLIDGQFLGVEGHYFALNETSTDFRAASNGNPALARPFFNTDATLPGGPRNDASILAFQNFVLNTPSGPVQVNLNGTVNVRSSQDLQSAGALLRKLLWVDFASNYRVDLVGGYRFLRTNDSVVINDTSSFAGGPFALTTLASTDQFYANNQFHGGEVGAVAQMFNGRWSLEMLGKVALGNNHQTVSINGFNTISTLGTTTPPAAGGLLAQPNRGGATANGNIGTYTRDVFAVLPEAGFNVRYDVNCRLRLNLGYTFLYLDKAARSGRAIPTQLNGSNLSVAPFAFHDTGYWAQGVNLGAEYKF